MMMMRDTVRRWRRKCLHFFFIFCVHIFSLLNSHNSLPLGKNEFYLAACKHTIYQRVVCVQMLAYKMKYNDIPFWVIVMLKTRVAYAAAAAASFGCWCTAIRQALTNL